MPTTPEDARNLAEDAYGFVPNLFEELSEHNPAVAKAYLASSDLLQQGTLSDDEREVVQLAISRYNDCHYCSTVHATAGLDIGLDNETVETISRGGLPSDERYRALVQAARLLLDKRGWLDEDDLADLQTQGLSRAELYEINAFIGLKTLSNYVNHVNETPVDPQIEA